jgi:hypothetical protein
MHGTYIKIHNISTNGIKILTNGGLRFLINLSFDVPGNRIDTVANEGMNLHINLKILKY